MYYRTVMGCADNTSSICLHTAASLVSPPSSVLSNPWVIPASPIQMLIGTQGKTWAITKHTQTHTWHCNSTFQGEDLWAPLIYAHISVTPSSERSMLHWETILIRAGGKNRASLYTLLHVMTIYTLLSPI